MNETAATTYKHIESEVIHGIEIGYARGPTGEIAVYSEKEPVFWIDRPSKAEARDRAEAIISFYRVDHPLTPKDTET